MIAMDYQKYSLQLRAVDRIRLPPYKGAAFRGGFGYAFRRVVCALKKKTCDDCLLKARCVYAYIFETPPPPGTKIMRKYTRAPHPFVIEPPEGNRTTYEPGEILPLEIVLVGKAIEFLPYFIYTFETLGEMGLGRERGKFHLETVLQGGEKIYDGATQTLKTPPEPPRPANAMKERTGLDGTIALEFLTPTRIRYNKHLTVDLEFHILIRSLLRRIALLSYFHCGGDPEKIDFPGLIGRAEKVEVARRELEWGEWERYSTRQKTRMKLGGFVGRIDFAGDLAPFLPYLHLGEGLHVGKATSFGLGRYRIFH